MKRSSQRTATVHDHAALGQVGTAQRLLWTSVFGSERLTGALLDRLTHHVHILEMNGDSYRLKQSKKRQSRGPSAPQPASPTGA